MSSRSKAPGAIIAKSLLVVGSRMKRGSCDCKLYKEGPDGALLAEQRVNIAYVAPGEALLVRPNDMILSTSTMQNGSTQLNGAIKMDGTRTLRTGSFSRGVDAKMLCPHRFVCPRCPWQHISPSTGPLLKLNTAKLLVENTLRKLYNEREGELKTSLQWLDPLPLVPEANGKLRARSTTLYFGMDVSGSYAIGAQISDFFGGVRNQATSPFPVVEPIGERCLLLSPTAREVVRRMQRLWQEDRSYRSSPQRSLKSLTLVESPATGTMLARVVIHGTDMDDNALRVYSDPSHQCSKREGQLVEEILRGCVTSHGGVFVEVVMNQVESKGASGSANLTRQLHPSAISKHDPTATQATDILNIVVPTTSDGSQVIQLAVPCKLQAHGSGQGLFRYAEGIEAAISSSLAIAAKESSGIDALMDYPADSLSDVTVMAARASGLWTTVIGEAEFMANRSKSKGACLVTRLYGGPNSGIAKRSVKALASVVDSVKRVVAVCEDSDAVCSLVEWLYNRGATLEHMPPISIGLIDVDPMSHHFSVIVSWENV